MKLSDKWVWFFDMAFRWGVAAVCIAAMGAGLSTCGQSGYTQNCKKLYKNNKDQLKGVLERDFILECSNEERKESKRNAIKMVKELKR